VEAEDMLNLQRPPGSVHTRPHYIAPEELVASRPRRLADQLTRLAGELERDQPRPAADAPTPPLAARAAEVGS
jgi:hypothetical protein